MKHLTLFFLTCWIFWFSQIFAISTICGLSDIPVASVIALGNNVSELVSETLNNNDSEEHSSTILPEIDTNNSSNIPRKTEDLKSQNDFIVLSEVKTTIEPKNLLHDKISSDEYNDSGGTTTATSNKNIKNEKQEEIFTTGMSGIDEVIRTTTTTTTTTINLQDIPQQQVPSSTSSSPSSSAQETSTTSEMNLTIEEKPIPVFSEWAQKQMEEAEKKLEKQVVNSSSSKKNTTNGNKMTSVKLRAKNYASPDCGAKIIASNSEAQNTGALLSSSKDEYMLSPCTNRIWFVIELCEAIQLEKVNLANFELFSSSPKNFSVAVSNRFPTRDWSNVGRFIAEDNRQVQSFDLHPHLFGKFVRVDVHSHYNSEHFCPISLFHVYGTSEFEAFETENRPHHEDLDEYDDDISADPQQQQQQNNIKTENNLFKSASDAVISIVKKAAQVLVKTNSNETENENDINNLKSNTKICFSPKINFICGKCNQTFVQNVNELLSCKFVQLLNLLNIKEIKESITKSSACPRIINRLMTTCNSNYGENYEKRLTSNLFKDKQNILLNILPGRYLIALCHLINTINLKNDSKLLTDKDTPLNLTLDKKISTEFLKTEKQLKNNEKQKLSKLHDKTDENLQETKPTDDGNDVKTTTSIIDTTKNQDNVNVANENNYVPSKIPEPPTFNERQVNPIEIIEPTENVNIFNVVDKDSEDITTQHDKKIENDKKDEEEEIISTTTSSSSIKSGEEDVAKSKDNENEQGSWESLDKLFSEQTSSENLNSNSNNDGGTSSEFQATQRVQSESIFIRLSNRIKALERNMSLSGQYLEELSRRYKKQVEELQYSFTKTLSAIEEQNRNANERENILSQQYKILEDNVTELTIHFKSLIICLLPLLLFQFIVSWFFIRSYRRRYLELIKRYEENSTLIKRPIQQKKSKKLCRRRSIEGIIVNQQTTKPIKIRRPSEEAMKICGSYKDLLILEDNDDELKNFDNLKDNKNGTNVKQRQRKLSIFYGKIIDNNHKKLNYQNLTKYERLESVSEDFNSLSATSTLNSSFKDDELIPDDDYESYVPGSDLAYNEFMPDGPSGNGNKKMNGNNIEGFKTKKSGKIRKLSSPRFLKSPFNKYDGKKLSHGPTGWEWYRSKKLDNNVAAADKTPSPVNGGGDISMERLEPINGIALSTTSSSKGSDESMRVSDISSSTTTTNGDSFLKNGNGKSKKRSSFRKMLKKVF